MNYLDLFSGLGGFPLGAYNAGWRFENHYFSEVDEYAIKVYRQRFPDAIPLGDITKINGKALADTESVKGWDKPENIADGTRRDSRSEPRQNNTNGWLITGGFPCQDISVAGKGEGITGRRSGLWFEMWRLIRDLRPRYVIAENVAALTFRGLDAVLSSLAEISYDAEVQDIRASDVGAPHRRERIWIVAYPSSSDARQSKQQSRNQFQGKDNTQDGQRLWDEPCRQSQDVADTVPSGLSDGNARENRQGAYAESTRSDSRRTGTAWATEPDVGRVAHGIPARVDRLKCLGNAIVPQIAEMIFRQLAECELTQ